MADPTDDSLEAHPRVALITGASRGLGAGVAARLLDRGLAVGLCARRLPTAPAGSAARCAALDVRSSDALEAFAARVTDELGQIDLWINNAGVLDPIGPLREQAPEALQEHLEINILGVVLGSRVFARLVHGRAAGGTLINVSSGAAQTAYEGWAAYGASKAAVDQLSRVLAREGAPDGLRVVSLAPGVVDTDMQALIRDSTAVQFPAVDRFKTLKADDAFNDPAWVADRMLDVAGAGSAPWAESSADPVVVRIPDQPRT